MNYDPDNTNKLPTVNRYAPASTDPNSRLKRQLLIYGSINTKNSI